MDNSPRLAHSENSKFVEFPNVLKKFRHSLLLIPTTNAKKNQKKKFIFTTKSSFERIFCKIFNSSLNARLQSVGLSETLQFSSRTITPTTRYDDEQVFH